ncbi:MAG: hypothetical protein IJV71_05685 [Lachnospiraceae bacterium]|nr:hypothetical protein [Lachnospiraceae bacterium]
MKPILVAHTVIATKAQALELVKRLISYLLDDMSCEMAYVIDTYTEQLVNAGFLTWEEAEAAEIEAFC